MRISTAHNHRRRFDAIVRGIYADARRFGYSHEQILTALKASVYDDPAWGRLPGWARDHVSRTDTDALDALHRPQVWGCDVGKTINGKDFPHLRWMHTAPDGTYVERWDPTLPLDSGAFRWSHTFTAF